MTQYVKNCACIYFCDINRHPRQHEGRRDVQAGLTSPTKRQAADCRGPQACPLPGQGEDEDKSSQDWMPAAYRKHGSADSSTRIPNLGCRPEGNWLTRAQACGARRTCSQGQDEPATAVSLFSCRAMGVSREELQWTVLSKANIPRFQLSDAVWADIAPAGWWTGGRHESDRVP